MKYLLIHLIAPAAEYSTDGLPTFDSWLEEMLARGVTLHGDRLRGVDDATTVQVRDREMLISDGPFAETKEQIAGFAVLECVDVDEAIEVASRHPTALVGTFELRPYAD